MSITGYTVAFGLVESKLVKLTPEAGPCASTHVRQCRGCIVSYGVDLTQNAGAGTAKRTSGPPWMTESIIEETVRGRPEA